MILQQPPIALIIFSNDLDNYLSNIEIERKYIEEALEHYHDTNRLKVITRSSVNTKDLFDLFNRYKGRIALFHFAGHASGTGLNLNNASFNQEIGQAEGLAALFHQEATEGQLQLVFLNGCSTEGQLEGLKEAKVPSIITTNIAVNDTKAIEFARVFYQNLAHSDRPTAFNSSNNIQHAFETATAYLKSIEKNILTEKTTRGLRLQREKGTGIPWVLYSEAPEWKLPTTVFEKIALKNHRLKQLLFVLVPLLTIVIAYFYNQYRIIQTPIDLTITLENQTKNAELPPLSAQLTLTYKGKTEKKDNVKQEAIFKNLLPSSKEDIHLVLEANGFERRDTTFRLQDGFVLPVRRDDTFAWVRGYVSNEEEKPVAGARVVIMNQTTLTNETGHFAIKLPFELQRKKQIIQIFTEKYNTHNSTEPIFSNETIRFVLKK